MHNKDKILQIMNMRFTDVKKHYMVSLLVAMLFAFSFQTLEAQNAPPIEWQKSYGGSSDEFAEAIVQTSDGGYIVAGYTTSTDGDITSNNGNNDFWVVKTDADNNIIWENTYGGSGNDLAYDVQQTTDGGYIVAGYSRSSDGDVTANNGSSDFWMIKLDAAGTLTWEMNYGGTSNEEAKSVVQTTDGGYIVAGYTRSSNGDVGGNNGSLDYWVVKTNSVGVITWSMNYGGNRADEAQSIKQTTDGGYILAGNARSNNAAGDVSGNHGNTDYWLVKITSLGVITWQTALGGTRRDDANSIAQTSDGGYIVTGHSRSSNGDISGANGARDMWVVKTDGSGNIVWQNALGGSNSDEGQSIAQTMDGGYIVAGRTNSNDGDVSGNHGSSDYWLVKLDVSGSLVWQKPYGGANQERAFSVVQTSDDSYALAGFSQSNDGDVSGNHGFADFWAVKLFACNAPVVIACPDTIIVGNDIDLCGGYVNYAVVFQDSCLDGEIEHSLDMGTTWLPGDGSGEFFIVDTSEVWVRSLNDFGGDTCMMQVVVLDTQNPESHCTDVTAIVGAACDATVTAHQVGFLSHDNCDTMSTMISKDNITFTTSVSYNAADLAGSPHTVYMQVCDIHGNCDTCSALVFLTDDTAPMVTCPADLTVNNELGQCYGKVPDLAALSISDNCGSITVTQEPLAGSLFGSSHLDDVVVSIISEDTNGNKDTCTTTVTLNDNEQPSLVACPGDVTIGTSDGGLGDCEGEFYWSSPEALDNCHIDVSTYFRNYFFPIGGPLVLHQLSPINHPVHDAFPVGTTLVIYTVEDDAGNRDNCQFAVTVIDDEAPEITCPMDLVVLTSTGGTGNCEGDANWTNPTPTDNCMVDHMNYSVVSQGFGIPDVSLFRPNVAAGAMVTESLPEGSYDVTYNVWDTSGNMTVCSFEIVVEDDEDPMVTCPANITLTTQQPTCSRVILGTILDPTWSDNCPDSTIMHSWPFAANTNTLLGAAFPLGTWPVTWTVTDKSGNTTSCTFFVTIEDNDEPYILNCPDSNYVYSNDIGQCGAIPNFAPLVAIDNCSGIDNTVLEYSLDMGATWTAGHAHSLFYELDTTDVWYRARDLAGNISDTCMFKVIVNDTESPNAVCTPITVAVGDMCDGYVIADQVGALSTDNCDTITRLIGRDTITLSDTIFFTMADLPLSPITVNVQVCDTAGNCTWCSAAITLIDTSAPMITCPVDVTVDNEAGQCHGIIPNFAASAFSDNCDLYEITQTPAPGLLFGAHHNDSIMVQLIIEDIGGNKDTCDVKVTLNDIEQPNLIACPADVTLGTSAGGTGDCFGEFYWVTPEATDNCQIDVTTYFRNHYFPFPGGPLTLHQLHPINHPVHDAYPVGKTLVIYTVRDLAGNKDNCQYTVTVIDDEAPEITCPADMSIVTSAGGTGDCEGDASWTNPTPTDNCAVDTTNLVVTYPDNSVELRTNITHGGTESGTFPKGVSSLEYTTVDTSGNVTTCTFTITVTDDEDPIVNCPNDVTLTTQNPTCGRVILTDLYDASWTDNCPNGSIMHNYPFAPNPWTLQGAVLALGTTPILWTVTDEMGNTSSCLFSITIEDNDAPIITNCPDSILVYSNEPGECGVVPNFAAIVAIDNCNGFALEYRYSLDKGGSWTVGQAYSLYYSVGETEVWYVVEDAVGNVSDTCKFVIQVNDDEAPDAVCSPVTVMVGAMCDGYVTADQVGYLSSDNCDSITRQIGRDTITLSDTIFFTTADLPNSPITVHVKVCDTLGNCSWCSTAITLIDTTAPMIVCPADMTINNEPGQCHGEIPDLAAISFSDNCDALTITQTPAAGLLFGSFHGDMITVELIIEDNNNNRDTCDVVLTLNDNENPTVVCLADITIGTSMGGTGNCEGLYNWVHPTGDDNCTIDMLTVRYFNPDGSEMGGAVLPGSPISRSYQAGTTRVRYTVEDEAGNMAECNFYVTVLDDEDPEITCPADMTVGTSAGGAGDCEGDATWTNPTPTDNCSVDTTNLVITYSDNSVELRTNITHAGAEMGTFPKGVSTLKYTTVDTSGNMSMCSFTITVEDDENPVVTCPNDVTLFTQAPSCQAVIFDKSLDASFTDNCPDSSAMHNYPFAPHPWTLQGALFGLGTTPVTWTATDAAGNTHTCMFTVTIEDNDAPIIINCPDSVLVYSNELGECGAVPNFAQIIAEDNCNGFDLEYRYSLDKGGSWTVGQAYSLYYEVGETEVWYVVEDAAGNVSDTCKFVVQINDDESPDAVCTPVTVAVGDMCEGFVTANQVGFLSTDNCDSITRLIGRNTITLTDTIFFDVSDLPLSPITVHVKVCDTLGNCSWCSTAITLIDTSAPMIVCPADVTVDNELGQCHGKIPDFAATAFSDNCDLYTITQTPAAGLLFGSFHDDSIIVQLIIEDNNNNRDTCEVKVTLRDVEQPNLIACPANVTIGSSAGGLGDCAGEFYWVTPEATDNCHIDTMTYFINHYYPYPGGPLVLHQLHPINHPVHDSYQVGTTLVIYTVRDAAGNKDNCQYTVTVLDDEPPIIVCPADMTVGTSAGGTGDCEGDATWTNPTPTDNCALDTTNLVITYPNNSVELRTNITHGGSEMGTFPKGVTTLKYITVDTSGNTENCSFTITVEDDEDPVVTCPADVTLFTQAPGCTKVIIDKSLDASWTDNCPDSTIAHNYPFAPHTWTLQGALFAKGITPVTWTATDEAGNTHSCTFLVTVEDDDAPIILNCPDSVLVYSNDPGSCGAVPNFAAIIATDNCDGIDVEYRYSLDMGGSWTVGQAYSLYYPVGITEVWYVVEDMSGNVSDTCKFVVQVNDDEAPDAVCSAVTVLVGNMCEGFVTADQVGFLSSDNCDSITLQIGRDTITLSDTIFFTNADLPFSPITVHVKVCDTLGNCSWCSAPITLIDTVAPMITCPADMTINNESGFCYGKIPDIGATAFNDNCDALTITQTPAPGLLFGSHHGDTLTVRLIIEDNNNNRDTCDVLLTLNDNENPFVVCPLDVTVNTSSGGTGDCNGDYTWIHPVPTDNCHIESLNLVITDVMGGIVTMNNVVAGSTITHTFGPSINTLKYTTIDSAGNMAMCTWTVRVVDDEKPEITCPANIVQGTDADVCEAVVNWNTPSPTDNCVALGDLGFTIEFADGTAIGSTPVVPGSPESALFPLGVSTVCYTIVDTTGNSEMCCFTVTIEDTEDPVLTCPSPGGVTPNGNAVYIQSNSTGSHPWGGGPLYNDYITSMDAVFGVGGWDDLRFEILNPALVFSPTNSFIYIEGSSLHANELNTFLMANLPTIEAWVNDGGRLLLNAAPNEGGNINFGFGGVTLQYPNFNSFAQLNVPMHSIVTGPYVPTGTTWTGNSFGHAVLITPMFQNLITDNSGTEGILAESLWGNGLVLFGGMTASGWHSPQPQTRNLKWNILDYMKNGQTVGGGLMGSGDTILFYNTPGSCEFMMVGNGLDPELSDNCPDSTMHHDFYPAPHLFTLNGAKFPVGATKVTWVAVDAAGNTDTCMYTVLVEDNEPPVFVNCPDSNWVIPNDPGWCGAIANFPQLIAEDNCVNEADITYEYSLDMGATWTVGHAGSLYYDVDTTEVWHRAIDTVGNISDTCMFLVIVQDKEVPAAVCTPVTVYMSDACEGYVTAQQIGGLSSDNCDSITLKIGRDTVVWVDTIFFNMGDLDTSPVLVNLMVCDTNGNCSLCATNVHLKDTIPPGIVCPADFTMDVVDNACYIELPDIAAMSFTDNCNIYSIEQTPPVGTNMGQRHGQVVTVMLVITDNEGNRDTCMVNITLNDPHSPEIDCPASVTINTSDGGTGDCVGEFSWTSPLPIDNCHIDETTFFRNHFYPHPGGPLVFHQLDPIGHPLKDDYQIGVTRVVYTVRDSAGNKTACSYTVTVLDDEDPIITCPADVTGLVCGDIPPVGVTDRDAFVALGGTVSDNCTVDAFTVSYIDVSNGLSTCNFDDLLVVTRTYTVTDSSGNFSTCEQRFIYDDDLTPPVIVGVPNDTLVACAESIPAIPVVTASDNCMDNEPLILDYFETTNLDSCHDKFVLTRTWTAYDNCNNSSTLSYSITVRDTIAPMLHNVPMSDTVDCQEDIPAVPSNVFATDNCDQLINIEFNEVTVPGGCDDKYDVVRTWTATDACGNVMDSSYTIFVRDTTPPVISGGDDFETLCDDLNANNDAELISWLNLNAGASAVDNCSQFDWTNNYNFNNWVTGCGATRYVDVTFYATDECDNVDSVTFRFGTIDTVPPVFQNCPRLPIVENAETGHCDAYVNFSAPYALDNCTDTVLIRQIDVTGLHSGSRFPVGTTILIYEATDGCNNSDTCEYKIIVNDFWDAPDITCPQNITLLNDPDECGATVFNLSPMVADTCIDHVSVTYSITDSSNTVIAEGVEDASGEYFPVGTNKLKYCAQDQPILLITEVTQMLGAAVGATSPVPAYFDGDLIGGDYVEITNFGPATMDLTCMTLEIVDAGGSVCSKTLPNGTMLGVGDVLVFHVGMGVDDAANSYFSMNCTEGSNMMPRGYVISLYDHVIDVVTTNGFDPVGKGTLAKVEADDWSGVSADLDCHAGYYRNSIIDTHSDEDWELAESCNPATLGTLNIGLPVFTDNGTIASLQSTDPGVACCTAEITIEDIEIPTCVEYDTVIYAGATNLNTNIDQGDCYTSVINVATNGLIGDINVLNILGTSDDVNGLEITLISPEGTEVLLFESICSANDKDFDLSLDDDAVTSVGFGSCNPFGGGDTLRPEEALKSLYEENMMGAWTLQIENNSCNTTIATILSNWELEIMEMNTYSQGDTTLGNDLGLCGAKFMWIHPILEDNCCIGDIEVEYTSLDGINVPSGGPIVGGSSVMEYFEVGTTKVRYILTDKAGNISMCMFSVTVEDRENPIITNCPGDQVLQAGPGECEVFWHFGYEATDNCEVDTIIVVPENGTYLKIGVHVILVIAKDKAGNSDTCTFKIDVLPFIPANGGMTCNNQIQLSLDENCTAELTADMILEGNNFVCYELYGVDVTEGCDNKNGAAHSKIFTLADVGKCFTVTITDPFNGNSCWGCVCIEDKLFPVIECPVDTIVECAQAFDPSVTGRPIILSCVNAPSMTYRDQITDNGKCEVYRLTIERKWSVKDASGNEATCTQIIQVKEFDLMDVVFPGDVDDLRTAGLACDAAFDAVLDEKINPTLEEIRPGVENPHFPSHDVDVTNGCFIGCVDDYLLDTALYNANCRIRVPRSLGWNTINKGVDIGHPSPFPIFYKSHWQWVRTRGRRCFGGQPASDPNASSPHVKWTGTGIPTIGGKSIYDNNKYCSLSYKYEDEVFDACEGEYEIHRHWKVVSKCMPFIAGINPRVHTQVIRVIDGEGPEIIMPDEATAGMNSWSCFGTWNVPAPDLKDNCSTELSYYVISWTGRVSLKTDGTYVITGLAEGVHSVVIVAEDGCGNITEKDITLTVVDDIPPTPVCDSHTAVSLTNSNNPALDFVKIYAEDLDDGSFDNCKEVFFKVIRMDELLGTAHGSLADNTVACQGIDGDDDLIIPGNQVYFDNFVKFCCADVGQTIMVVLRVFDIDPGTGSVHPSRLQRTGDLVGHYSECMVEVEVQNKSFPIVVAPDDVVVSCGYWFDDSEDALSDPNNPTFGRVLTNINDRTKLTTTDIACESWCEDHNYSYLKWFPKGKAPQFVPSPSVSELACKLASDNYNSTHPDDKYNFVWGWEGFVSKTCGVVPEIRVNDRRECGQGLITRDIIVTVDGVRYTDRQEIWVLDCDPFYINPVLCRDNTDDIEWPLNCSQPRTFDGCGADLSPDNPRVGKPEIVGDADDNCAMIAVEYSDDTLTIVQDACFKVIRDWRVIDWCHFDVTVTAEDENGDPYGYAHPHPGEWHYQQILKVVDKESPVVNCSAGSCEPAADTTINGTGGCHGHIELSVDATDDCSPAQWLTYDYKLDIYNDRAGKYGTYDVYVGKAHPGEEAVDFFNPYADDEKDPQNASGIYPLGEHKLEYYVEDGCGNVGVCSVVFEVTDCKAPTPYCETGIITVVMPSSGAITIWAKDLDAGSFDNCTAQEDLKLYFNGDTSWTGYVVNCDTFAFNGSKEKYVVEVELWVEDEEGNTDYCITTIEVQDNNGVCADSSTTLAGIVLDRKDVFIEKAEVRLMEGSSIVELKVVDGEFEFRAVPSNVTKVGVYKNNDPQNGVSTRDLVAIQKHLLGHKEFTLAYDYIAADANNNGKVSTSDISTLRKLILGRVDDLSKWEQLSWRFVPRDHVFNNPKRPFPYPETLPVPALMAAQIDADFRGIKIGDLTGDAQPRLNGKVKTRNAKKLQFETKAIEASSGELYRMDVTANNFEAITGMQYTLDFDPLQMQFVSIESGKLSISTANYSDRFADRGHVTMSWNEGEGVNLSKDDVLFTMVFETIESIDNHASVSISSKITSNEAYDSQGNDYDVSLRYVDESGEAISEFALYQNVPNPFKLSTEIRFDLPSDMITILTFYDANGKILKIEQIEGVKGNNVLTIDNKDLNSNGVIYYQLDASDHTATRRMMIVK